MCSDLVFTAGFGGGVGMGLLFVWAIKGVLAREFARQVAEIVEKKVRVIVEAPKGITRFDVTLQQIDLLDRYKGRKKLP